MLCKKIAIILLSAYIGYNNAAGILADKNHFPGIEIVRFGENISVIHKRATFVRKYN